MESENSFSIISSIIGLIQGILIGCMGLYLSLRLSNISNSKTIAIIGLIVSLIIFISTPIITGYYPFINYLPIAIIFLFFIIINMSYLFMNKI